MLTAINLRSPLSSVRIHDEPSPQSARANLSAIVRVLWEDRITFISLATLVVAVGYLYVR